MIEVARVLFQSAPYEETTIRSIARAMGQSTGLVFSHFPDKESVWRAAMGTPPPTDSPLTRAAPEMLAVLQALLANREMNSETEGLRVAAQRAVDAAQGVNHVDSASNRVFSGPTLEKFGAEMIAEARAREALPELRSVMDPVFGLCQLLVAHADGKASGDDVHAAAVTAGATIAQVAVYGTRDATPISRSERSSTRPASRTEDPVRQAG